MSQNPGTGTVEVIPIACDFSAMDTTQRERHESVWQQIQGALQGIEELSHGYAMKFQMETSLFLLLAEFITLERLCCPFINFALEIEPADGPLWLKLTGQDGVKEFLQAELELA